MAKDIYGLKIPGAKASPSEKRAYLERAEKAKAKASDMAKLDAKIKAATKRK